MFEVAALAEGFEVVVFVVRDVVVEMGDGEDDAAAWLAASQAEVALVKEGIFTAARGDDEFTVRSAAFLAGVFGALEDAGPDDGLPVGRIVGIVHRHGS